MLVVVDGPNVGVTNLFAHAKAGLRSPSGVPTGAAFGFARQLRALVARLGQGTRGRLSVQVCWDSRPSWREAVLPAYKASRAERRDEAMEELFAGYAAQLPLLRRLLRDLGCDQLRAEGWEADDFAGLFFRLAERTPDLRTLLVSSDHDFVQLVGDSVTVWQPKQERFVSPANIESLYGARSGDEYRDLLAITGDGGDDVPGCKGIGPAFALKYLRGELPDGKRKAAIEAFDNPDGHALTLGLVDLRRAPPVRPVIRRERGRLDRAAVAGLFAELGFASLDPDEFCDPFTRLQGTTT